jgi:hypothetical protein
MQVASQFLQLLLRTVQLVHALSLLQNSLLQLDGLVHALGLLHNIAQHLSCLTHCAR